MTELEKKCLDIDYILEINKIIKLLLDNDRHYTLYDSKQIRKHLKILLKYLEKGE